MLRRFAALDDTLIDRWFQPLADQITGRFGIGRFRAATLCIDGAAFAWLLSQAGALAATVAAGDAAASWMPALTLLLGLVALTSLRTLFQRAAGGRATANPLRPAMRLHRAVVLLLLVARLARLGGGVSFADAADVAMLVAATASLYFGACGGAPPLARRRHSNFWAAVRP
jgi:hypothetical protein